MLRRKLPCFHPRYAVVALGEKVEVENNQNMIIFDRECGTFYDAHQQIEFAIAGKKKKKRMYAPTIQKHAETSCSCSYAGAAIQAKRVSQPCINFALHSARQSHRRLRGAPEQPGSLIKACENPKKTNKPHLHMLASGTCFTLPIVLRSFTQAGTRHDQLVLLNGRPRKRGSKGLSTVHHHVFSS